MPIDIEKVKSVLRKVREIALPHYGNLEFSEKSGRMNDLLTELDVKVETYLRQALGELYPEIGFVGEETGGDRTLSKFWLCDPIDGTAHFVRGIPFCTTMLAYIEDGEVVASFIYQFVEDKLYYAQKGQGAFCEGEKIEVSDRPSKKAYLSWETKLKESKNLEIHFKLLEHASFFKLMCAGHEFILVATGKIEGRICFDPYGGDYDYAAGSLLVREAGGIVANIGSENYDFRNLNFLAVNPQIYNSLVKGDDAVFPIKNTLA